MTLLFDENLTPKLPALVAKLFPSAVHVRDCGLKGATDEAIWNYAAAREAILVSKDSDFYDRSLLYGPPPKVIWLRLGNCSSVEVVRILTARFDIIEQFAQNRDEALLQLA